MLEKAKAKGVKLLLPVDTVIADAFSPDANSKVVKSGEIPAASATALVPTAKAGNSNTPMGPFHTTVPAPFTRR